VRSDDSSSKSVSTIKAYSIAAGRTVNLNFARVRLKAFGRILGGYSALDRKPTCRDTALGQPQLGQSGSCGDLNLCCYEINPSDLLGDRMFNLTENFLANVESRRILAELDLHSGIDFNEVISVFLVDQEFSSTSIAVANRFGEFHSIIQNLLPYVLRKVFCWSKLYNLLVPALDTTVTLIEMDDIAIVITQQLNLDMLRAVQESLIGFVSK
jgi:hypothetical protein